MFRACSVFLPVSERGGCRYKKSQFSVFSVQFSVFRQDDNFPRSPNPDPPIPTIDMKPELFNLERIAAESGIASLEFQPEVPSTNDWALRLATDAERPWPLLVLTGEQTGGRGRGVNRWWSATGALTFSLVIDITAYRIVAERCPCIALATGLAVCEALQEVYPPGILGLKWPNDVHLSGRKLCGILVESQTPGRIVIGVGMNVNNSLAEAPPEVRDRATSLADVAGESFDLSETLVRIVAQILARLQLLGKSEASFANEFRRYCILTGCTVQIEQPQGTIVGLCEGIDASGALQVRTPDRLELISSGTVSNWWR